MRIALATSVINQVILKMVWVVGCWKVFWCLARNYNRLALTDFCDWSVRIMVCVCAARVLAWYHWGRGLVSLGSWLGVTGVLAWYHWGLGGMQALVILNFSMALYTHRTCRKDVLKMVTRGYLPIWDGQGHYDLVFDCFRGLPIFVCLRCCTCKNGPQNTLLEQNLAHPTPGLIIQIHWLLWCALNGIEY